MVQFEKMEFPERQRTEYHISDDYGHTAQLSAEQVYDLLQWLYHQRDELRKLVQQPTTLPEWTSSSAHPHSNLDAVDLPRRMREDWSNDE
jgi:hypothetical protein